MNETEIFDKLDKLRSLAKVNLEEEGSVTSTLFINIKNKGVKVVLLDFKTKNDKVNFVHLLSTLISTGNVLEYLFVAEAWMANYKDQHKMQDDYEKYGSVYGMPDKKECIIFQYCTQEKQIMSIAEIIRTNDDVVLGEWDTKENPENEGIFQSTLFGNLFSKAKAQWN